MCVFLCGVLDLFQFRKIFVFAFTFGLFICRLLWAVSLGFLEEFLWLPNKTIGYKMPLLKKILESILLHKEKAVVKPLSLEKLQAFSWSCWIWRQAQPLRSQKKWKQWSRTKTKRNFNRPLAWEKERGVKGQATKQKRPMPTDLFTFREGWTS